jgi:hypothetical protein
MNFAQNLSMVGASIADFKGNDLLDVDGALSLSDTWSLALGTGFQNGGSTTVFTYGSGTFSTAALAAARINATGLGFTPSGPLSFTDTGSAIMLNGISAIPEPATWALLAGSLTVLMVTRRRRNV